MFKYKDMKVLKSYKELEKKIYQVLISIKEYRLYFLDKFN